MAVIVTVSGIISLPLAAQPLALATPADETTQSGLQADTPSSSSGEAGVATQDTAASLAAGGDAAEVGPSASQAVAQTITQGDAPNDIQTDATPSVSDAADKAERESRRAEIDAKVRNPTLRKHLMENIDIFGKSELPAIYILGPGIEEFEGQLLTRDFMRDNFFMQNIDREEFEMKMWLRGDLDFEPRKKEEEKKVKPLP